MTWSLQALYVICEFLPILGHGPWKCSSLGGLVYQQLCLNDRHHLTACCSPERWKDPLAQQPTCDFHVFACFYDGDHHAVFLDLCVLCSSKPRRSLWWNHILCDLSALCNSSLVWAVYDNWTESCSGELIATFNKQFRHNVWFSAERSKKRSFQTRLGVLVRVCGGGGGGVQATWLVHYSVCVLPSAIAWHSPTYPWSISRISWSYSLFSFGNLCWFSSWF